MNLGKTIFAQLKSFLPDYEFNKCVNKYKDNLYCKTESGLKGSTLSTAPWLKRQIPENTRILKIVRTKQRKKKIERGMNVCGWEWYKMHIY